MQTLNDRLRELRKKSGLTQPELAEKLGISRNYISALENGFKKPSYNLIGIYSQYFGVSTKWITEGDTILPSPSELRTKLIHNITEMTDEEITTIYKLFK